ncbi:DnaJ domain-containing protein [Phenylobacterium sp.]|uniref:J domain-containing protein n=1 Tax=Phenylobacterium sp. TaxID=1871053 RepID=UPI0028979CE6|nr:DnaJ domain-containing protein [Phenylobacterium sp.]
MIYFALGCAALLLLVWLGRGKPMLKRREWRFIAGVFAIACFAAAAYVGVRGGWGKSIVLVVLGLWLAVSTRRTGMVPPPSGGRISDSEARSILGVGPQATEAEIREAYGRLMRMAHPDKGGTSGLAAQLNAARDRLLKK